MDEASALVIRFVVVETLVGVLFVLVIGPRLASRHVKRQAAEVTRSEVLPVLVPEVERIVKENVAFVRADAEQRIRDAQAQIAKWQADAAAEVQRQRDEAMQQIEDAKKLIPQHLAEAERSDEMARRGQIGNEVKAEKATREDALAALIEERFGPDAPEWAKNRFPRAWKVAMFAPREMQEAFIEKAKGAFERESAGLVKFQSNGARRGGGSTF